LAVIFRIAPVEIGGVIRALRMAKGQSLESVALDAGADGSNLSRIERGVQRLSADGLQAIAKALGCTAAELYALAEGKTLGRASSSAGLEPADLEKDAVQMRRYFRRLRPEFQKLALELVKTLARLQQRG
jgi:transcriptional regulator with XRE-family HTH domain